MTGAPNYQRPIEDEITRYALGCGGAAVAVIAVGIVLAVMIGNSLNGCHFDLHFGSGCDDASQPLQHAAANGDDSGVSAGLETSSDPANLDEALACAARGAHPREVARLLKAGANPNAQTASGHPLSAVVSNGSPTDTTEQQAPRTYVVRELLAAHADPDEALRSAAERSNPEVVGLLLDAGAHIDGRPTEASPLASAVFTRNDAVVDLLIARGADPNQGGAPDETTLTRSLAAGLCARDTVGPIKPHTCGDAGTAPPTVARTLFHQIPATALRSTAPVTPLAVAVLVNDPAAVATLLAAHADPNRPSLLAYTPLWLAVDLQDTALATALVRSAALADPPPGSGVESPLALARTLPTPDLANLLTGPLPPP